MDGVNAGRTLLYREFRDIQITYLQGPIWLAHLARPWKALGNVLSKHAKTEAVSEEFVTDPVRLVRSNFLPAPQKHCCQEPLHEPCMRNAFTFACSLAGASACPLRSFACQCMQGVQSISEQASAEAMRIQLLAYLNLAGRFACFSPRNSCSHYQSAHSSSLPFGRMHGRAIALLDRAWPPCCTSLTRCRNMSN